MKKIVFSLLCMLMLGFSSCIKDGDNVANFSMLAVVGSLHSMQPTIVTPDGTILAPDLLEHLYIDLYEGDALLVSFSINYDNQPSTEYLTASNLQYEKIGKSSPIPISGSESGEFSTPIEDLRYIYLVGNTLFFEFIHKAPGDQKFEYEMTYNREEDAEIPTIYLRAKKIGTGSMAEGTILYLYAFDMRYLFMTYKDAENKVTFNIKYKTGVNEDGMDMYDDWADNPYKIEVK